MPDTAIEPRPWKEGFVEGMPFEEYAAVDALNGSALVHLRRSPMYFKYLWEHPQPPTQSMVLGAATHQLILEPNRVGDFAVWGTLPEEKVRNGKVWNNFKDLNKDAVIVTKDERDTMVGISVAVAKSAPAAKYIRAEGQTELSMFWIDSQTKMRMKGRIDKIVEKGHTIVDLKTTRDCRHWMFSKQAFALGYHIKAAMYASGYKTLTGHDPSFKFIAVEKNPPHECAVYHASKDLMIQGQIDLQALLIRLMECYETQEWPPEMVEESDLRLPEYAYADADELADLVYE